MDDGMSVAKAESEREELEKYFDREIKYIRSTGDMVLDHIDLAALSTQIITIEVYVEVMKRQSPEKNKYVLPLLEESVSKLRKAWDDAERRYRAYNVRGPETN